MNWNYMGIDDEAPGGKLLILTEDDQVVFDTKHRLDAIAWTAPHRHPIKEQCLRIMHGLPELKMVACICQDQELMPELTIALLHYEPVCDIAALVDLVRTLDRRAHAGPNCIPNPHGDIS